MVESPASLPDADRRRGSDDLGAIVTDGDEFCRFDGLGARAVSASRQDAAPSTARSCASVAGALGPSDRLLFGYGAAILSRIQGACAAVGRDRPRRQFQASKGRAGAAAPNRRPMVEEIKPVRERPAAPPDGSEQALRRVRIPPAGRAAAVEKDDLSLLGGLGPKEIAAAEP